MAQIASAPNSRVALLHELPHGIAAIGLETGPLSQWLHKGLTDAGNEGLTAVQMTGALSKNQGGRETLVLQAHFDEIHYWSDAARPRGRPREVLRGRRRADMALFNGRGRSIHVIEAKGFWQRGRCFRDIKRLLALLNDCGLMWRTRRAWTRTT